VSTQPLTFSRVDAGDGARCPVVDRDLALEVLLHRADVLATRADDQPIFSLGIWIDSMRGAFGLIWPARLAASAFSISRRHVHARFACSSAFSMIARVRPSTLDVHLQRGDATAGADDLEVHVTARVLAAEDVGEDRVLLALHHEAHRDARDRLLDGHTGVHHRQACRSTPSPSTRSRCSRGCR
jgi:hypothetical protein